MELGNLVFGNSRGEYPIRRRTGWEDELDRLFRAYAPDTDNLIRSYGPEFENDTFSVFPYYWGDCECGFEDKEKKWYDGNSHDPHCYQVAMNGAYNDWLKENPEPLAAPINIEEESPKEGMTVVSFVPAASPSASAWREWFDAKKREMDKIYDELCERFGLKKVGCAAHCTCDYKDRYVQFTSENDHNPSCGVVKPNFLHKPSGFAIQWYKYPLRDSYSNQKLSLAEFSSMIDDCIKSLKHA